MIISEMRKEYPLSMPDNKELIILYQGYWWPLRSYLHVKLMLYMKKVK